MKKFFSTLGKQIGIDLGTSNTLVYDKEKGLIINEPSVVAVNQKTDAIVAVGSEARKMIGKTPQHIVAIKPLVDGVISDFEVTEKMLKYFIDKATGVTGWKMFSKPRVVIGIPLEITEVEKKAVEDAVLHAGAKEVFLIETPIAAAIGCNLPIQEAIGTMIVDIGAGTTEIAVLSLGGVVTWKTIKIAGDEFNKNIINYARTHFNLVLGEKVAEEIKVKIGSADTLSTPLETQMRGRDIISGLPKEIIVNDAQIRESLSRSIQIIINNIKSTLEVTPPELVADIYERGITLIGGGALLKNISVAISKATKIPVHVAEDPITAVVRGTGYLLDDDVLLKSVTSPSTQDSN
ncbi:rod shape-determining protein [Candidatus Falkowbacteria bacterium]|nr:rod shape-determining protein [Candidatus Falkowbacteria bacterium]